MEHAYRWMRPLLAALFFFGALGATAQQPWRPFRPGLIYSYDLRDGSGLMHTLRVDSAYQTSTGDSVYAFNRLMRRLGSAAPGGRGIYVKSRNNLFGARVRWTPGQSFYVFESDTQPNVQNAASLRIYPLVAVGQTWAASTSPLLTGILRTRNWQAVRPGVQDSVATVEVYSGTATTGSPLISFVVSRAHGLIEASPWLGNAVVGTPASAPLVGALPVPLLQSPYSPLALFTMQPGDELGYFYEPFSYFNGACTQAYTLRRILTRQQRADSLVFTYREQVKDKSLYSGPNCNPVPSVSVRPVSTGRLAFSLATGRSAAYPALPLLTGEYASVGSGSPQPPQLMGLGIAPASGGSCLASGSVLRYQRVYYQTGFGGAPTYATGLDALAWWQSFTPNPGMGDVGTYQTNLIYYRRSTGTPLVCGSFVEFADLLPTRAAQAAALATLHPNPAAESATLTLTRPAGPGQTLRLADALGRTVWRTSVSAGQTAVAVPLAGRPTGLYLLHLTGTEGTAATWKLHHE
ncbi:MAG TPA: T9SS type A sorting domain-containing protein [Hymenobacter sp.]|jgi:hypothetical protein|uniref:T9SS type A sorting domain-containing protein n=1 Tax=Hymenobacter sp. TaxID=1898978 RepID=UPI002ED8F0E9